MVRVVIVIVKVFEQQNEACAALHRRIDARHADRNVLGEALAERAFEGPEAEGVSE